MGLFNAIQPVITGIINYGSVYSMTTTDVDPTVIAAANYLSTALDMTVPYTQRKILPGAFIELQIGYGTANQDCFCYWVSYNVGTDSYTLMLIEMVGDGALFPALPANASTIVASSKVNWSGGLATLAVTVTGAAAGDIPIITPTALAPTTTKFGAVVTTNTLTITLNAADAGNLGKFNYLIVRLIP